MYKEIDALLAKKDLDTIQSIILSSLRNETEDLEIHPDLVKNLFKLYFHNYGYLGIALSYDVCINPLTRIVTIIDILEIIARTKIKNVAKNVKEMYISLVAIHTPWFRVQEKAIYELKLLDSKTELVHLKKTLKDPKLLKLIDLPLNTSTKIASFFKKVMFWN